MAQNVLWICYKYLLEEKCKNLMFRHSVQFELSAVKMNLRCSVYMYIHIHTYMYVYIHTLMYVY